MGGASQAPCVDSLLVIEAGETVHDVPDEEPPSDDVAPLHNPDFPDTLHVMNEEDLIGKPASVIYEDSLKQLAKFLVLPVKKCPCTGGLHNPVELHLKHALLVMWCGDGVHSPMIQNGRWIRALLTPRFPAGHNFPGVDPV
uniref:Transposase n=1 Tax=Knipowitschia caucasica TaxID=637954 RepID=A0AAV2L7Y9_KNICA